LSDGIPVEVRQIPWPSFASLYLQLLQAGNLIGTATGFVVQRNGRSFLVTNRHVLRGTQPDGRVVAPDHVTVVHNSDMWPGAWVPVPERLYSEDGGKQRWYEHPDQELAELVDVAVLPLREVRHVKYFPLDPWEPDRGISATLGDGLSVIGFPFGITAGAFLGVWIRGFIATDPQLDWQGLPRFLIDARTRAGQSGSPVMFYQSAGAVAMRQGGIGLFDGAASQFFGVYSGRINAESDLGIVWKRTVIGEIVDAAVSAMSSDDGNTPAEPN
jgi:S1-C subfamily serine protease